MQKIRPKMLGKEQTAMTPQRQQPRSALQRPFWLTNSAYYGTTGAIAILLFFLVWGFSSENSEQTDSTFFPALIVVVLLFAVSFAFHGVVLRRAKNRYLLGSDKASFHPARPPSARDDGKFTLEKHGALLKLVQRKADAANANAGEPEKHLDVYKTCTEYLEQVEAAMPTVHVGSPRLAAFRGGQERVRALQRHHLLQWAEDESRFLLREAQVRVVVNDKIEVAQRALEVLDAALQLYPNEGNLIESSNAIQEFIAATYISYWIELAERAAFKGQYAQAIDHYRDALFYLMRESVSENQRQTTAAQIESEIRRLESLSGETIQTSQEIIVLPPLEIDDEGAGKN
jgi:tetratricopeptide (TPR) repeat protein